MNFRVLSFILAVLLFACTDYTQDESSSKIAKSATSSAGENKAHTNAEAGESIRHIVPIKKELSTLRERIAKGHSMISYARKKGISIPEFACESFRKAAEDGVVTIRQHNYMGLPQEEKTTQNFMAIILQYREIEVMLDDSALSGFADAERAALLKELRAAGAELLTEAHNGALKAGNQREAEMICNSAMQIGISREVVDKLRQKSVTADFSSMEETFNSYLKNHDIDLRYGQLFLKHMKDAGASAKTLERNRKKLQEESDRRLLAAVRRNTKAGSYLGGTFTSVETPESVAKRMKLLPPGEKILPELKALLNEAATDHLVRTFRQIFNPDQNSPVAWKEVEEVLNKAQQSGVPAEVLERAERIVKNEVTYYVQRRLWGLLANTGIDYGKSGQSNFELTIKFIDYTARFGIEKEKLEEWRRQVYEMRDVRFQRKFEWLLHTAKFDKAEALLQEAEVGGMKANLLTRQKKKIVSARQEHVKREFWRAVVNRVADRAAMKLKELEEMNILSKQEVAEMRVELRSVQQTALESRYGNAVRNNDTATAEKIMSEARTIGIAEETLRSWQEKHRPLKINSN